MNSELERLEKLLAQKQFNRTGCITRPYRNTDGTESWQEQADKVLCEPDISEIICALPNSSGKTAYNAYAILTLLNGTHEACKLFDEPLVIFHICKKYPTQKITTQLELAKASQGEVSALSYNKKRYHIVVHGGVIKEIHCRATKNVVFFASAEEGATGAVGIRPHILIIDEPISQDLKNELVARLTKTNSRMITSATVISAEHAWMIQHCRNVIAHPEEYPRTKVLRGQSILNPYFNPKQLEHWKATWGEDSLQYRVRALGELAVLDGVVLQNLSNFIVTDDYIPEYIQQRINEFWRRGEYYNGHNQDFIWLELQDYGTSDPTMVIWIKAYTNGELVVEDEFFEIDGSIDSWSIGIHKKREELGLPFYYTDKYAGIAQKFEIKDIDGKIMLEGLLREPDICKGDGRQLIKRDAKRKNSLLKELQHNFIYPQPTKSLKVDDTLPIVQSLIQQGAIKVKERCLNARNMIELHVWKEKADGGREYGHRHTEFTDLLRYAAEAVPNNQYIRAYLSNLTYGDTTANQKFIEKFRLGYSNL